MKRVYPSNTLNYTSVPQLEEPHKTEQNTIAKLHQSTISKGPLSLVPSEASQSFYQIIEKNKVQYLEGYGQFTEMKFMENLAGLKNRQYKIQLLESFFGMFDDMVQNLIIIQNTLIQINFDAPDFNIIYDLSASNMMDIIYKDIKTLEGIHLELVYNTSLRFLETVLEALQINVEFVEKLFQIDIKVWSAKCLNHLSQFKVSQRNHKQSSSIWCCFR